MSQTVSISQAVEQLGIDRGERWFRRFLQRREEQLGRPLLVNVGSKGSRRPTYHVSLANLRIWCPELFDPGDSLAKAVRALERRFDRIEEQLDDVRINQVAIVEALRRRGGR